MSDDFAAERARLGLVREDLLRRHAFIDGIWVAGETDLTVTNPATTRPLGTVPNLGALHAERAVSAAHAALPDWRALTGRQRGTVLRRWFDLVMTHQEDLARLMTAEQGKPLAEARAEIVYAAAFIEWFAEEARRIHGDLIPASQPGKRLAVMRQPVGVVAAITPWNFPAAMITRKVAPALAVGCTVVLKPSELTPFSALALAVLAEEAGVPRGALNIVTGDAAPIGEVLTDNRQVRKFTFTGSTAVGKMLAARCAATVKRVSLELGGNAPFIVFDDADLDRAVEGAIASKFRNAGQTCVCANRFYVQDGIHDAFTRRLAERAAALTMGDGLDGTFDQGPLINEGALDKVEAHVSDAVAGGARLMTGGERSVPSPSFYPPTVLADVRPDALLCRAETFGPVAGVVRFATEAEAVAMANDTSAGLAAYVFTSDADRAWRVPEALEYGMVGLNTGLISSEVAPFGGIKEAGLGREGSRYGVEDYLDMKTVCTEVAMAA